MKSSLATENLYTHLAMSTSDFITPKSSRKPGQTRRARIVFRARPESSSEQPTQEKNNARPALSVSQIFLGVCHAYSDTFVQLGPTTRWHHCPIVPHGFAGYTVRLAAAQAQANASIGTLPGNP